MKKILISLINLFYPNLCRLCKRVLIEGETAVCLDCLYHLPRTGYRDYVDNPVFHLLIDRQALEAATALYYYEQGGQVQKLVHLIKYYGHKELGYQFGRQAAREWREADHPFQKADFIVPLPLHPKKQRRRGYNQSEWIARGIAEETKIPLLTTAIRRDVMTESQTRLKGYNRWLNVKDIFSVIEPERLAGKHILLVDDVITSGSTVGACMDALSVVPGVRISVFALTMAAQ